MKAIILTLAATAALHCAATAQTNTTTNGGTMNNRTATKDKADGSMTAMERSDASATIGGMSRAEFDRMNMEGNQKVAAIKPTSTPLSKKDQKLMVLMAEGGMMQLQLSQAAVGRIQRDDVKVLAQSEVEEQTGVSAKIMEIAHAKGMTLNTEPTAPTQQMLLRMEQTTNSAELDRFYTKQSGVDGHEKLMKTGERIMKEAQDPALKALAEATAPVIKMHMQVSRGVLADMGKGRGGSMNDADGGRK